MNAPIPAPKLSTPNVLQTLIEQRIEEQSGVPLDKMTASEAVAAMAAASSAPVAHPTLAPQTPAPASPSAPQLLAQYLKARMTGSPQTVRAFVQSKADALRLLAGSGKTLAVQDVVAAVLSE